MKYTVIVRFFDEEDPRSFDTYIGQSYAESPQEAAEIFIDELIHDRGLDPSPEDMPLWRMDYKTVAVFEGWLENMAP
jgi:hypothetical protein